MTIHPLLDLLSDLGDRPRLWVDAPPIAHGALVEAAIDASPGDVLVQGRRGDSAIALSSLAGVIDTGRGDAAAAVAALKARLDGRWLIVRSPALLDATSAAVIQTVVRDLEIRCVFVSAVTDLGAASSVRELLVDTDGRIVVDGPIDEASFENLVAEAAEGIDDEGLTDLAHRTGRRRHLLEPLLAHVRQRELETPGSSVTAITELPDAVVDIVRSTTELLDNETRQELAAFAIAGLAPEASVMAEFGAHGLTADAQVVPIVTEALVAMLDVGAHRRLAETVVELARTGNLEPREAVDSLATIGVAPGSAAGLIAAVGRTVVGTRPWDVLTWIALLDDVARADDEIRTLNITALALVGRMTEALALADGHDQVEARLATAAGLAHAARLEAAASAYDGADPGNSSGIGAPVLGTPTRVSIVRMPGDDRVLDAGGVTSIAAAGFAASTRALLINTTEALSALEDTAGLAQAADLALWPDTPHTVVAMLHSLRHDHETATALITEAIDQDIGGAPFRNRHRAVAGWVALRGGRWSDAAATVNELEAESMGMRDLLLTTALDLALRRRSNDLPGLGERLPAAEALVRRHPPDLISLLSHIEVAHAIARAGDAISAQELLRQLQTFVEPAPIDPWHSLVTFHTAVGAIITADDAHLAGLEASGTDSLESRFVTAAHSLGIDGEPPGDEFIGLADELAGIGAVHEASLIVALAALRSVDESTAKRLLTAGRRLRSRLPGRGAEEATGVGALSEREVEVAHELIAGHTYKEIGSRLYISPKTVEHHVAHIKTKLAAGSRAEMLAALRSSLD